MKTAYLDIETKYVGKFSDQRLFRDCKNHVVTVIGVRVLDGANDAFVQLVGKDATKANLMLVLKGVERLVTYNGRSIPDEVKGYTGFDFPVIAAQLGVVLDREFPHVDLCPECWRKGLWGGQKVVEQSLGLRRKLPGKDGKWADETWKKYEATNDERHRNEVLAYNQEDVFMLRRIEEALQKR
ncbi:MAG: ribonuclease H-like domain-containing protein [Acidobacteriia bacterium]|nr:ribonuclease H-like domain-containing protein [Terriglobia bacterium]